MKFLVILAVAHVLVQFGIDLAFAPQPQNPWVNAFVLTSGTFLGFLAGRLK